MRAPVDVEPFDDPTAEVLDAEVRPDHEAGHSVDEDIASDPTDEAEVMDESAPLIETGEA